jgi:hypothetical protein
VQTRAHPEAYEIAADKLSPPHQNPVQYLIHCLESGKGISGPLSLATSRIGQQIVDTAVMSANEKRTVKLL